MMDPIFTPIFTSLLVSGLGVEAGAAGVTATVLSGIVTTAAGIGLSILTRPSTPPPENGSFAILQPLPPRTFAYGQCRVAGYIMFLETDGYQLFHVAALVGHRCSKVVQVYLNDDAVACSGGVLGVVLPGPDGRYKNGSIVLSARLGLDTETVYARSNYVFPTLWDAAHRGDTITSLEMTCLTPKATDFSTIYPYQRPLPSAVLQAALVFDPRDASQDPAKPSSFKYSDNPVLCILHFQCFSAFGPQRNFATAVAPILDAWILEANICDEQVPLKSGGTEKRFVMGGYTDTDKDPRSALQTMLATCDGWFVERGDGTIGITVGKYRTPTIELTDDDITGFMFQTGMTAETSVNSMVATYTSDQDDYKTVDTDPVENTADQVLRGRKNSGRLELTWVHSTGQASRLLKRETIRNAEKVRGRLDLKLSALPALYERWILISSSIPRLNGKVIENRKPTLSLMGGGCTIEFIGSGAEVDVYDPVVDESRPPTVITKLTASGPPVPLNVNVVAKTSTASDGSSVTYLLVSFDAPVYNDAYRYDLSYRVFYQRAATSSTAAGPQVTQDFTSYDASSGRITLQTNIVPNNQVLTVNVASIATKGAISFPSSDVSVDTSTNATPPDPPQNLATSAGVGQVFLRCTNPNSANFAGMQFYRGAQGDPFSAAVKLGSEVFGSPNGTSTFTDTTAVSGTTYSYWVTALNKSGGASSATGPTFGTAN